ncbi:hypothetical protein ABW21_db0209889 [Orbilia brochopaga]|nr:hypothetical protein ABW21_db0209889 [Drechslerella brochopaga]
MMGIISRIKQKIESMRIEENNAALRWRLNITVSVALSNFSSEGSKWLTFALFAIIFYLKQRKDINDEGLNVNILFTSLAILNIALQKLRIVIQVIPGILNAFGCLTRIEEFLRAETKSDDRLQRLNGSQAIYSGRYDTANHITGTESNLEAAELSSLDTAHDYSETIFGVAHLTAGWTPEQAVLRDISLDILSNQVTIIVGPVGCGKSTLLQTLLGETTVHEGFVNLHSSLDAVAYCAQTPWLVNRSIRDNIVGKSLFDADWYKEVVRCCALLEDLKLYNKNDRTFVGSKGVTLSGGQKQRIALARAVYSKKQIVILDDIFSGLDAVTEERIRTRLLGPDGLLRRNRNTVILATHATHLLPAADKIVIMNQTGAIQKQGTWSVLSTSPELAQLSRDDAKSLNASTNGRGINDDQAILHDVAPYDDEDFSNQITLDDASRKTGDIAVYKHYLKSVGWKHSLTFIFLMVLESVLWNILTVWLNKWGSDPNTGRTLFYMGVYTALALSFLALVPLWVWHFVKWPMSISSLNLHSWQLETLMRATMSYFSVTDVGITTNRFSQDFVLIDTELPIALLNCVESGVLVIGLLVISLIATAWIGLTLPFLGVSFYYLQRFYLRTSRQVRLLDIEAKSPLYTHFQETLAGISTVRAFNWEIAFREENEKLLSLSQKPYYYLATIQRWLAMVLDFIVAVLACTIALIAVQLRHSLNPGYIGLALLNTMSISEMLKILIIYYTDLETSLGAIARMRNFSKTVPQEAYIANDLSTPGWPNKGQITVKGLSASHK